MLPRPKPYNFFFSILTAIGTGVIGSFLIISGIRIIFDELLFPHISRSFEYRSAEFSFDTQSVLNGREVIQGAKESISSSNRKDVISASSYIVAALGKQDEKGPHSSEVLVEKNADTLLPLASVTKLVTAVVAQRLMPGDEQIEITKAVLATNGDTGKLRLGEKLTVDELMYPLLMVSSNDAAEALARAFDRKKFIKEMNDWANSIGAYRTYFRDPSGLSVENVSTARDITIITQWIQDNMPEIIEITNTKSKTVRVHTWTNPTHFLNLSVYAGGKNGYTPEANRTGLALFKLGTPEKMYAVVLLGSSFRDEDTLDVLDLALKKM